MPSFRCLACSTKSRAAAFEIATQRVYESSCIPFDACLVLGGINCDRKRVDTAGAQRVLRYRRFVIAGANEGPAIVEKRLGCDLDRVLQPDRQGLEPRREEGRCGDGKNGLALADPCAPRSCAHDR